LTVSVLHKFASAKGNGTDLTLIQPSNWNDQHAITCAANSLLGNPTTGNAAITEIALSAFMQSLLGAANAQALANLIGGFTTGDGKITLKTVADTGWVMFNDLSIGNTGSGATNFADPTTQPLFTLLYNGVSDAGAPVQTSLGVASTRAAQGSASAAWGAGCRIQLPLQLGRAIVGANGTNAVGTNFGSNTLALQKTDLPNVSIPLVGTQQTVNTNQGGVPSGCANALVSPGGSGIFVPQWGGSGSALSVTITPGGNIILNGGVAQTTPSIQQASSAWNVMVKL